MCLIYYLLESRGNIVNSKSVFSNLIWRFLERVGAQLVAFIVAVVLARILNPEDYGTVALITVFTTILQVFVDSGLGNALIQKKNVDNIDFSTVFFTNIVFCVVLYLLLFIVSPYIARFYGDTLITAYMRVLGLTVFISGIKNVQQAYVSRYMLFKKFFFATIGGTITAGAFGVIMAIKGYGAWALVAQQVINLAIDTFILCFIVKWRPDMVFSLERLKDLFSYGWKLLVAVLIDTTYTNIRQLLIGKIYSSSDLAQYNRGRQFPNLIVTNINSSIDSVLLPAMSKEQDSILKIKIITRRAIKISTYVMAPLMMGLAFCGKPIVGLILTDKWLPSVFYMQIFCITFMFKPIHTANLNAIKALGRSDIFLKLEIGKKIVGIIVLLATMFISVRAMAYSLLFTSLANQFINSFPNKKLLDYGYIEQVKDIFPAIGLAVFMGCVIYPIQNLGFSYLVTLLIQVPVGALIYVIGSKVIHLDSFEYLLEIIKSYKKKVR